jgi:multimeric flavodoxin WrbA
LRKIFAFIGSPLRERSNTYLLAKMVLDRLSEMDQRIVYEIITAGHVNLGYCKGCWTCLTKGHQFCLKDEEDDMGWLKKKMLGADFIIFGSPLRTGHMSGQMKTFFDRLASWYHIFGLAPKAGLTVVTTGGSETEGLHDFMAMLMGCLGIKVVAGLDAVAFSPGRFLNPAQAEQSACDVAERILSYVTGEMPIESDDVMERCFQLVKGKVRSGAKWLAGYALWKERGWLGLNSYKELLERMETGSLP